MEILYPFSANLWLFSLGHSKKDDTSIACNDSKWWMILVATAGLQGSVIRVMGG